MSHDLYLRLVLWFLLHSFIGGMIIYVSLMVSTIKLLFKFLLSHFELILNLVDPLEVGSDA